MKNPTSKTFELIHDEITRLRDRLDAKDVCPCCVGKALLYRGALVPGDHARDDATMAFCDEIIDMIEGADASPSNRH